MTTNQLETSFVQDQWVRAKVVTRGLKRKFMWRHLSGTLPIYLVPEFPKSGGTWFSQMLADCLEVPFYRNWSSQKMASSVMSGHHLYDRRYKNVTVMFRDGRDIMVSAYYHFLFKNDINAAFGVKRHRSYCDFADYDDIRTNLPQFIEYMFTDFSKGKRHFSWSDFVDSWIDHVDYYVTYRQLRTDPTATLQASVKRLTGQELSHELVAAVVDKYSFKKQAARNEGSESKHSFVRKGIVGDWRNQFTPEAREVFAKHAGHQLIRLGFEENDAWVTEPVESQPSP